MFRDCLGGRPLGVFDRSNFRFILHRAPRSRKILKWCIGLLPRHPEHIDAFVAYFATFRSSAPLRRAIVRYLRTGVPYGYVRGELWTRLAGLADPHTLRALRATALAELSSATDLVQRRGLLEFLLASEQAGYGRSAGRVRSQPALVQAWLVPSLPARAFEAGGVVKHLLLSPDPLPGLMCVDRLIANGASHRTFGLRVAELTPELQNALRAVGLVTRRASPRVDQVGELLGRRFGTPSPSLWRHVLGNSYAHALSLLLRAETLFDAGPSNWLMQQNSFNDVVFRAFVGFSQGKGRLHAVHLVRPGTTRPTKYGRLIEAAGSFHAAHPDIAAPLSTMNSRRNRLPNAHPYDTQGTPNRYLRSPEQGRLVRTIGGALRRMHEHLVLISQE